MTRAGRANGFQFDRPERGGGTLSTAGGGSGTGRLPIPPLGGSTAAGGSTDTAPAPHIAQRPLPAPARAIPDDEALALIHTDPAEWVRQGEERALNAWVRAHRLPPIVDESCDDCHWAEVRSMGSAVPIRRVLDEPCHRHDRSGGTA